MGKIEEFGLGENTIAILMSDNGHPEETTMWTKAADSPFRGRVRRLRMRV